MSIFFRKVNKKFGFSLLEILVVISILAIIGVGIGTFVHWGMKLWNVTQDQVQAQQNARAALKDMVGEIREMQISDNGSYPIESVSSSSLIFFANIDDDSNRERVRYELINEVLYRGVTNSTDDVPPEYHPGTDEIVTIIAENIVNTGYLFRYFDDTYNGETAPLSEPIELNDVRLIQIYLLVDYDPGRTPIPLEIETNVALRNLKTNL